MIKNRNMIVQIILFLITFGIYGLYWFYQTALEMKFIAKDDSASPALWTVLIFVPFGVFYSHYKYSELYQRISDEKLNMWILFLLWIVFAPAVWFIVQTDLNRKSLSKAT